MDYILITGKYFEVGSQSDIYIIDYIHDTLPYSRFFFQNQSKKIGIRISCAYFRKKFIVTEGASQSRIDQRVLNQQEMSIYEGSMESLKHFISLRWI